MKNYRLWLVGLAATLVAGGAPAQWIRQSITLQPGWNALYLEAAPTPSACAAQFAGLPVESVWKWNQVFRAAQFDTDPSVPMPADPRWLGWMPDRNPYAFLNTLAELEGHAAYLIKVATNAAPVAWTWTGRVIPTRVEWYPYQYNLVGMVVNPANPPSLAEYFRHTPEVDALGNGGGAIYEVAASGAGTLIRQTARYLIEPGRAYWVRAKNPGRYAGPLTVTAGAALDFMRETTEQDLTVRNVSPSNTFAVKIRSVASTAPPAGEPELAGAVPLAWYNPGGAATNAQAWPNLANRGITRTLKPGESWTVRWAVRRGDMAAYTPVGANGAAYQSVLEIPDTNNQYLVRVPVVAENPDSGVIYKRGPADTTARLDDHPAQGLWVGEVYLNQVSSPYFTGTNVFETPAVFTLRLSLHVDSSGQARLLQSVVLARAPEGVGTNYVYQLFANTEALPSNATDIYRLSSSAFPIMDPVTLGVVTGMQSGALAGTVRVGPNDALNPFLHRHHPQHDNEDGNWVTYTNAVETLAVSRAITLQMTAATNSIPFYSSWAMEVAEGVYREVITGVRRDSVVVQGPCGLRRVSREGTLN